jgi:twitching motility protein PilT
MAQTTETEARVDENGNGNGHAVVDDVRKLLAYVGKHKCSDLHVKTGSPPTVRISGNITKLPLSPVDHETANLLAGQLMSEDEILTLKEKGEVDFAYSMPGVGRFRVNIHKQRGSLAIAARRILAGAPNFAELGLPPAVESLANEHRGLMLVTGPTSSGKTTTTGAVISHINQTRACHILTIEDPIEILHSDAQAIITQREIGMDTFGFAPALRAAMRQDPDVIFIGEIRDYETVKAALQAAETGHFVVATLHTTNVQETVTRIIDFYPADQQNQARVAVAGSLAGIVSQRLLPKVDGGRVAAIEILINNGRIRDCILNPDQTHMIHDIVEESDFYGMQSFDQALVHLYRAGAITLEDAMSGATRAHDFKLRLQQEGLTD